MKYRVGGSPGTIAINLSGIKMLQSLPALQLVPLPLSSQKRAVAVAAVVRVLLRTRLITSGTGISTTISSDNLFGRAAAYKLANSLIRVTALVFPKLTTVGRRNKYEAHAVRPSVKLGCDDVGCDDVGCDDVGTGTSVRSAQLYSQMTIGQKS
jgi:hypothetical protein